MPTPTTRVSGPIAALCLLALLIAAATAGCASTSQPDPRENVEEAIRDFHNQLMWGRYEEAAGYLPTEQRGEFIGHWDSLGDDLEYTEFDLGAFEVDETDGVPRVVVHVELSYYQIPSYIVEETRIRETWGQDPETDYWVLLERVDAD